MAVNDFIVKNGLFVSTTATILGTRQATSTLTGALVVRGGVGIGQDLYVGGTIYGFGVLAGSVSTATNLTGGTAGQVPYQSSPGNTSFTGGSGTAGNVLVSNGTSAPTFNNTLTLASTNNASSTQTGALQVAGGAGVGQNLYVGGYVNVLSTTTTATINARAGNGAVWADVADFQGGQGGSDNSGAVVYVRNSLYGSGQGGKIYGGRWSNTDRGLRLTGVSFDGSENAYVHLNSEGTAIRLNIGSVDRLSIAATGIVTISTSTTATSTTSGALQVIGGVGVGNNVVVGGYGRFNGAYDEVLSTTTVGLYVGVAGSVPASPRIGFANSGTTWQIDNFNANFRIYQPNSVRFQIDSNGTVNVYATTASISTNTGALQVAGGVGIGQNLYVGGGLQVTGRFTSTGIANVTNTTIATSTLTGALVVNGGVGIGQDLWVGGIIYGSVAATVSTATQVNTQRNANAGTYYLTFVDSDNATPSPESIFTSATIYFSPASGLTITNVTAASSTLTGALTVAGGVGIGQNLFVGGSETITATTNATNTSSGALQVRGGAGIGGDVFASRIRTVSTTNATSTLTGEIVVQGGIGLGQDLWVGGNSNINGSQTINATTNATNTSSGALQVRGGVGIGGDIFASRLRTVSTTNATSTQTGEIVVQGGVGIGQNLYVGGLIVGSIASTVSTASQVTTVRQPIAATYYLTFVDSDNATAIGETVYTSSTIYFSPSSGLTVTNITAASSTLTGALTVAGGVGIGQNLYVGGLSVLAITTVSNTTNATSTQTGALQVIGGVGIGQNLYVGGGNVIAGINTVTNTTNATSTQTGALQVIGGVGIGGDLFVSRVRTVSTTNATSTQTGEIVVQGGVGIGQNLYVGGGVQVAGLTTVTNTVNATNTSTGGLQVKGGLGIGGDIFASRIRTVSTTNATSTITGEIVVQGGVGIGQDLWVGGDIYANKLVIQLTTITTTLVETDDIIRTLNTTNATNTSTGALQVRGGAGIGGDLYASRIRTASTTNATNTTTGEIVVQGGVGIGQDVYIGGSLNVTGIIAGVVATTVSTASQINTIQTPQAGPYFLTFVDSNNASATPETVYTSATIFYSPISGLTITNVTAASSTLTGALSVRGGAGFGQDVYIGGALVVGGPSGGSITGLAGLTTTNAVVTGTLTVQNLNVVGTSTFSGLFGVSTLNITSTTDATSTITGALIVTGGVGIGQTLYVSRIRTASTTNSVSTQTGEIVVPGGIGVGQDVYIGGALVVGGPSGGTITGLAGITTTNIVVTGTAVINTLTVNSTSTFIGQITATNLVRITNTTGATSTITGALVVSGGVGIGQELYAGRIRTSNTTNSVSTQTGDIVVPGGIGIGQDVNIGGALTVGGPSGGTITGLAGLTTTNAVITGTTNASSTQTGALVVAGGVGIGQDLRVGGTIFGNVSVSGTITTSSSINTQGTATARSYFLTFVDANNGSPAPQVIYTSSTIYFSPASGMTITNTTNASTTLTGALTVAGGIGVGQDLQVGGDVYVNGGDLVSAATTFNLLNATVTTLNFGQAGTNITIGATSGATTIRNATTVSNNANATSTLTGALQVVGGAGIGQNLYVGGQSNLINVTNATTTQTGALIVSGGVGIGQNLFVGGNSSISGSGTISATTNATNTSSGALQVRGGVGIGGDIFASRIRTVSTTNASSTITGEIIVGGGVGIGQDLYVGGTIYGTIAGASTTATSIYVTRTSTSTQYFLTFVDSNNPGVTTPEILYSSATITFNPGVGFAIGSTSTATAMLDVSGTARISGITTVTNTTNATNTQSGAVQVIGGVGIGGDLFVSRIRTVSTTNATSTTTGELIVGGGVGIGQNLYVGGNVFVTGTLVASVINSTGTIVATVSTSTTSNNLAGGAPLQIVYQTNTSTTGFITSPAPFVTGTTTASVLLNYTTASGYTWTSVYSLVAGLALDPIIDTFTSAGTTTTYALSATPRSLNHVDVNIDGVDQLHSAYTLSGSNLILSQIPVAGATIEVTVFTTTGTSFVSGPAGANASIQYNNAGNLGGATNFFYATTGVNLLVTTNAINTQSGALQVAGGVGIGQNLYVGGGTSIAGITTITNTTNATNSTTGALQVVGGVGVQGDLYARNVYSNGTLVGGGSVTNPFGQVFTITNTTNAISTVTGALQVYGGVGIGGNLYVGGDVVANRLVIEFTTVTTTLVVTDDIIRTTNTTSAVSTLTGALQIWGGAGIGGDLYASRIRTAFTTNASNTTTGEIVVRGGVGIGQDVYVGGNLNVTGSISGSISGNAATVSTIRQPLAATYYLTFVDSDNPGAQAETLYTSSTVYFSPAYGMTLTQNLTIGGTTNAVSTVTGAIIVAGGVGIGQNLRVGGALFVNTTSFVNGAEILTSATVNSFVTAGVSSIIAGTDTAINTSTGAVTIWNTSTLQSITSRGATSNRIIQLTSTTNATSTQTGTLIVTGGIGVGGQVYASAFTAFGAEVADGSMRAQVTVISTGTFTNTATAGIAFGTYFTATGLAGMGGITVSKANNVSGDLSSYLSLHTRNSSTQITEGLRITNTSSVIIFGNEVAGSTATGALRVAGGVGIGQDVWIGGRTNIVGITTITNTTNATTTQTGALVVAGGVGIGQNLIVGGSLTVGGSTVITTGTGGVTSPFAGIFTVTNTTNAGNTQSGAVQVYGGIGVGGNVNVGGVITATNLFVNGFAVSTTSGAISNPFSGVFTITNTTQSFSTNTGALQVYGGVGIGGNLYATSKSFSIAHPTRPGMTLNYGSLEGPEFGVYVRGSLQGKNIIELPDYWLGLVDANTITVSITPRGRRQEIYVEYIANNKVYLHGDDIDCYFIVYGERKDIDRIVVEK